MWKKLFYNFYLMFVLLIYQTICYTLSMCIMLTICDVSVESQDDMVFYVLNYFLSKRAIQL